MLDTIADGWQIVGIGDFNGDGFSDLLLRNDTGLVAEWTGQSDGGFVSDPNATVQMDSTWHVVGIGDFNGDGRADILWRNDNGIVGEWNGESDGSFTGDPNANVLASNDWHVAGTGDFIGDGLGDILWRNDNGVVGEWDGQFSGGFVGDANANIQMDSSWHVVGTGDFNGDGIDDILWRNDNGIVGEWDGQSDGSFVGDGNANIPVGNEWQIAGTGDFNGDGRADILWRGTDGTITDWLGQANGGFVDNSAIASQFVNTELQVAGVGDFNGDGKADVLWQASDGTLQTWVGAANGAIQSPAEKLWADTIASAQEFVDQIEAATAYASSGEGGGGTGGTVDLPGDFHVMFGPSFPDTVDAWWDESLPVEDNLSPASGSDLLSLLGFHFDNIFASLSSTSTPFSFTFNINGLELPANWFAGSSLGLDTSSNAIVITANVDHSAGFFAFDPVWLGFDFADGFGGDGAGGGGAAAVSISATARQHVIDALSSNAKFWAFKLNGIDVGHAILHALEYDNIIFSSIPLYPGQSGITKGLDRTIYVDPALQNDPTALIDVLVHEGLHQALFDAFGPHQDSQFEEALGKLVSAYVYTGLSAAEQATFANDSNSMVRGLYNDTIHVVDLSNAGNFQGIINYVQALPSYSGLPVNPRSDIYDKIGDSF